MMIDAHIYDCSIAAAYPSDCTHVIEKHLLAIMMLVILDKFNFAKACGTSWYNSIPVVFLKNRKCFKSNNALKLLSSKKYW